MAKKIKANIGERIRTLRGDLQQKDLAKDIGISVQVLSNYEINKNDPPLSVAVKLAEYFGVTLDYLVNGTVQPVDKIIEDKTGLSSESVRVLKKINKYCTDKDIPNPVNSLIEKKEFQDCIDEINCSTIILLNDKQGTTEESLRSFVHKLNVQHILSGQDIKHYQGIFLELSRLHAEEAKNHIGKAIDKIRMGVWNNGTR